MTTQMLAPLRAGSVSSLLGPDFNAARTLPVEAYLSEEVLEWERRNIFGTGWISAGRSDQVPEAGSQCAITVNGCGLLLVRGNDGIVRAFHNRCRHRGHEFMADGECRRQKIIACPYHAWTYSLTGELTRAARFTDMENFDSSEFPLVSVATAEYGGWIFVATDAPAHSFEDSIGALKDHLADWEPERLVFVDQTDTVVKANWKLIVDNSVECYHCPSIHPELCRVSDPDGDAGVGLSGDGMWIGGPMLLRDRAETMSLTGKGSRPLRRLTGDQLRQVRYFTFLPSLLISVTPDYLMTHRLVPLSATETVVECAWFFPPETVAEPDFDPSPVVEFWQRTNNQDFLACESVNRAMHTPGYQPGPFDHREIAVHAFQVLMARAYTEGKMPPPAYADLPSVSIYADGATTPEVAAH